MGSSFGKILGAVATPFVAATALGGLATGAGDIITGEKARKDAKAQATKEGHAQAAVQREAQAGAARQKVDTLKAETMAKRDLAASTSKISERARRKGKANLLTGAETGLGGGSTGLGESSVTV